MALPDGVIVDECDMPLMEAHAWRVHLFKRHGDREYWYVRTSIGGRRHALLHRVIAGAVMGQQVDHINGNGLDNRRSNLRICTHSENMRNTRRNSRNTSGYKGVRKAGNGWTVFIQHDGQRKYLGYFKSAAEGHEAYKAAAQLLHGEFHNLG
jgi:hypothetical protein